MPDRPDPVTDRLARFTPSPAGLDRDALLFAAGRQSARGSRVWAAVASLLTVSQVVTLVLLWPRSPEASGPAPIAPEIAPAPDLTIPPSSSPRDVWTAGSSPDVVSAPGTTGATGEFVLSGPPLTAGSGLRFD